MGSIIWNATWSKIKLIQDHSFWEVRNGLTIEFWVDSWQQFPPLMENQHLAEMQRITLQSGLHKVVDYWTDNSLIKGWRDWKITQLKLNIPQQVNIEQWNNQLNKRRSGKRKSHIFCDGDTRPRVPLPSRRPTPSMKKSIFHL